MELLQSGAPADGREYLHWDKLRQLKPPPGLNHEEWWFIIKWGRLPVQRAIPLTDPVGSPFVYSIPDLVARLLHYVDQRCSGEIAMSEVVTADEHARQRYLVNSLMEEAIRSSQLEGATTSRKVAKEMLRSGREPKNRSERMIHNNYHALQFMREGMGVELTPQAVLELQRILTEGTLDNPDAAGRLQRPDEERVGVYDRTDGKLLHAPPPADQLPDRLQALCDFANEGDNPDRFTHPVVRAILLHFWLGYDHPFEDGNGRTARALFYWSMRTHGYWLVEYLSISQILRQAPGKYTRAFVLTETDEFDATYFVVYQLNVIQRAVEELHQYLQRKIKDIRDVERLLKGSSDFNHRQLALLSDAIRTPDHSYTFASHAQSHGVTHETARNDLLPLVKGDLLEQHRRGRTYIFTAAPELPELLKRRRR
ncbi:MAG: Fic family protein [Actinomycetota bacterium]|nr:Fic family protein [Actinomycetota bacterium]